VSTISIGHTRLAILCLPTGLGSSTSTIWTAAYATLAPFPFTCVNGHLKTSSLANGVTFTKRWVCIFCMSSDSFTISLHCSKRLYESHQPPSPLLALSIPASPHLAHHLILPTHEP